MYKSFPDFCFWVFSFSLILIFKTVCQKHINSTETRFAILEIEKLFLKQLPNRPEILGLESGHIKTNIT